MAIRGPSRMTSVCCSPQPENGLMHRENRLSPRSSVSREAYTITVVVYTRRHDENVDVAVSINIYGKPHERFIILAEKIPWVQVLQRLWDLVQQMRPGDLLQIFFIYNTQFLALENVGGPQASYGNGRMEVLHRVGLQSNVNCDRSFVFISLLK